MSRIALIGYGEVGHILDEDFRALGHTVSVYDVAVPGTSLAEALAEAELVVSAVTPGSCVGAAQAATDHLPDGAWFFDLNSASPGHKTAAAQLVDDAGGRYVEAALMSAIGPRRLGSPFLLGGAWAAPFAEVADGFGLTDVTVVPGPVGRAAATKLCRSVVVKGLEALFTEGLAAARHHGVEDDVLASLSNILPEADWEQIAGYFVSRSLRHGRRRSEEMLEAAATVDESGIEPLMSQAASRRQSWAASLGVDSDGRSLSELLDRLLAARSRPST